MARKQEVVNVDELLDSIVNNTDGDVKKLDGRVWGSKEQPLEKGDWMVGQLIAVDDGVGDHGSTMLRFEDPNGDEVATWQRGTLKTKVTRGQIGKFLLIRYMGTEPPRKKNDDPMNVYEVFSISQAKFASFAGTELPF